MALRKPRGKLMYRDLLLWNTSAPYQPRPWPSPIPFRRESHTESSYTEICYCGTHQQHTVPTLVFALTSLPWKPRRKLIHRDLLHWESQTPYQPRLWPSHGHPSSGGRIESVCTEICYTKSHQYYTNPWPWLWPWPSHWPSLLGSHAESSCTEIWYTRTHRHQINPDPGPHNDPHDRESIAWSSCTEIYYLNTPQQLIACWATLNTRHKVAK